MKPHKLWKPWEDGRCCSSSAIQSRHCWKEVCMDALQQNWRALLLKGPSSVRCAFRVQTALPHQHLETMAIFLAFKASSYSPGYPCVGLVRQPQVWELSDLPGLCQISSSQRLVTLYSQDEGPLLHNEAHC